MRFAGVRALAGGDYAVRLSAADRRLLQGLAAQVRELVERDDEAVARLFPPAYRDDPDAQAGYERLVRRELVAGRVARLRVLEQSAGADRLDDAQADAWCSALNDVRLVLGERLGISEDLYERDVDRNDPRAPQLALYLWLTWLQSTVVDALARRL
ncbi:MAG TPA: DUF2017 family protein [Gaiellaceae bacterium]|nr:DUF2017 family protein [Gaiellaceae bacterium]